MGKIRRLNPMSYWLIGEHESWFSHMASKGYHLTKINQLFSTFEKQAPANMKYRIELVNGTALSIEQIDLYEECGWDYITSSKLYHIFASPAERAAMEIYTDPTEQAITVDYLKKASKKNLLIFAITTVIMFLLLGGGLLVNDPFFYWLVHGGMVMNFFLICIYGVNSIIMFRAYKGLKQLAIQLEQGQQINHEAMWQRKFMKEWVWGVVFLAFVVWMVATPWYSIYKMQSETLPEDTTSEPILRMETLLDGQYVRNEIDLFHDGSDYNHYWEKEWSLLAPIMYETRQDGFHRQTEQIEQLSINYYEMRAEAFAKPMLASLIDYNAFLHHDEELTKVTHDVFDELYVYEDEFNWVTFYARLGKQVIDVSYTGELSADELIDKAAAFYQTFE